VKCVSINFLAMVNFLYPPLLRIATMIAPDFDSDYAKCSQFSAKYILHIRLQVPFISALKLEERFDTLTFLFNNRALG